MGRGVSTGAYFHLPAACKKRDRLFAARRASTAPRLRAAIARAALQTICGPRGLGSCRAICVRSSRRAARPRRRGDRGVVRARRPALRPAARAWRRRGDPARAWRRRDASGFARRPAVRRPWQSLRQSANPCDGARPPDDTRDHAAPGCHVQRVSGRVQRLGLDPAQNAPPRHAILPARARRQQGSRDTRRSGASRLALHRRQKKVCGPKRDA